MNRVPLFLAALFVLTLAGCYDLERKVTWSADGKTAAVIGDEGLRLCELDGEVSDVLVKGARLAEWMHTDGEEKLVVLRYRAVDSWQELGEVLVEPLRVALAAEGEAVVKELRTGTKWREHFGELWPSSSDWTENDQWEQALKLYVAGKLSEQEWQNIGKEVSAKELRARVGEMVVYPKRKGLMLGEPVSTSRAFVGLFEEIRISPTGRHAAFVISGEEAGDGLWVVSLDAEGEGEQTERRVEVGKVGLFPDWTPDGQSLVYTRPERTGVEDNELDISLGYLVSRQIFDEEGKWLQDGPKERHAWLLFYEHSRVRCLKDGRILCSAIEAHFPVTEADLPQSDNLFQFDPARPATLTRVLPAQTLAMLPDMIALFEVSPDGSKIVVADAMMSQVFAVDIATGELHTLQEDDLSDIKWMPSWTPDGQLCFRGRPPEVEDEEGNYIKQPVDVLLWDGKTSRAIGKDWPEDLRDGLDL